MADETTDQARELARQHVRGGWWMLLVFLSLGLVLETLHGFKVGFYLDVANETRRHQWTLAHAHGTLLALVNIAFGWTLGSLPAWQGMPQKVASRCLFGASILMPGGFLLGGAVIYGGDPGLGIFLLPVGAAMLFVAVLLVARASATR
ncbi:MAG: hypothetical protein VCE43_23495 [Myxococcota bacterium]